MMQQPRPQVRPPRKKSTSEAVGLNAILTGLAASEVDAVIASGELISLPLRYQIYEADEPIRDIYFPIDCVLSVVTRMKDGSQIEVGTIGREGISAIPLLLGATTSANECYCQVPGTAVKIGLGLFESLKADTKFRQLLDRYVQAYVNMLGQLAACNRLHTVYERCARWLLMTQDRVASVEIRLTHEYLAMMLGTQRSGVTSPQGRCRTPASYATATASSRSWIDLDSKARHVNVTTSRASNSGVSCDRCIWLPRAPRTEPHARARALRASRGAPDDAPATIPGRSFATISLDPSVLGPRETLRGFAPRTASE